MTFWASQSKDRAYVINLVSWYRQHLDRILTARGDGRTSSGTSQVDFEPDVTKTFNRGYSTYFIEGRSRSLAAIESPKMVGEYVGIVDEVHGVTFTVKTSLTLNSGDGLCWFDEGGGLRGTVINAATTTSGPLDRTQITPDRVTGIRPGLTIYRNRDHRFLHQVERSRPVRKIAVQMRLESVADGFRLSVEDEDGNRAVGRLLVSKEPALKPGKADSLCRKQLAKTGDTVFTCIGVDLAWDQPYFVPIASINALRRQTLDDLLAERAASRPLLQGVLVPNDVPYPQSTLTYLGNVLNQKARDFYRRHGVDQIEPAAESGLNMQGRVVMRTRYCLKYQLGLCDGGSPRSELREPLALVDEEGHRYELHFDCAACEMEISY
jgi:putative protease